MTKKNEILIILNSIIKLLFFIILKFFIQMTFINKYNFNQS